MTNRAWYFIVGAAAAAVLSQQALAQDGPRLNGKPNFAGLWTGRQVAATAPAPAAPPSKFQGGAEPKKLTRREQGLKDVPLADWGREAFLYYTAGDGAWQGETGGAADPRYHGGVCGGPKSPSDLGNNLLIYQTPQLLMISTVAAQPWIRKVWIGQQQPSDLTDLVPFWMGHSVGRWEGDTLVVDTVRIKEGTPLDTGRAIPQSGNLRMTERFSLSKDGNLQIERTFADPVAFSKPWSDRKNLVRQADSEDARIDWEIQEPHAVCDPKGGYSREDDPWFDNYDKLKKVILPDQARLDRGLPPVPPQFKQK